MLVSVGRRPFTDGLGLKEVTKIFINSKRGNLIVVLGRLE